MEAMALKCPSCGGSLENASTTTCGYCGSLIQPLAPVGLAPSAYEQEQRRLAEECFVSRRYEESYLHWENVLRFAPGDLSVRLRMYQCAVMATDSEEDILSSAYDQLLLHAPPQHKKRIAELEETRMTLEDEVHKKQNKIDRLPRMDEVPKKAPYRIGCSLMLLSGLGIIVAGILAAKESHILLFLPFLVPVAVLFFIGLIVIGTPNSKKQEAEQRVEEEKQLDSLKNQVAIVIEKILALEL